LILDIIKGQIAVIRKYAEVMVARTNPDNGIVEQQIESISGTEQFKDYTLYTAQNSM